MGGFILIKRTIEQRRKKMSKNIGLAAILAGAILLTAGFNAYDKINYKNGEKLLRSYSKTFEYYAQDGDSYWKIGEKYFPEKVKRKVGMARVNYYFQKILNHDAEGKLRLGEKVIVPCQWKE